MDMKEITDHMTKTGQETREILPEIIHFTMILGCLQRSPLLRGIEIVGISMVIPIGKDILTRVDPHHQVIDGDHQETDH